MGCCVVLPLLLCLGLLRLLEQPLRINFIVFYVCDEHLSFHSFVESVDLVKFADAVLPALLLNFSKLGDGVGRPSVVLDALHGTVVINLGEPIRIELSIVALLI